MHTHVYGLEKTVSTMEKIVKTIVTLDEQLAFHDVAINPGDHPMAAAMITEELYNEVK